jgi:predicted nucleic acid-binding protein
MGKKYLIDSNVVIDYLRGSLPVSGMAFMDGVINDIPKVPIVTKIEVLGFHTTPEASKLLTDFFEDALVFPLSDEVVEKTIELRKHFKIKLPDAIIAATALVYNLTLVTRNVADFQHITGLTYSDAHQQ